MSKMLFRLDRRVKVQVRRMHRRTRDKALAMRCQIVLLADEQRTRRWIAEAVGCSLSWVNRVIGHFREFGPASLHDARADNGALKIDERYLSMLYDLVDQSPQEHGYTRPTWTQELLARVMRRQTGVKVHRATMSRALALITSHASSLKTESAHVFGISRRIEKNLNANGALHEDDTRDVASEEREMLRFVRPKVAR